MHNVDCCMLMHDACTLKMWSKVCIFICFWTVCSHANRVITCDTTVTYERVAYKKIPSALAISLFARVSPANFYSVACKGSCVSLYVVETIKRSLLCSPDLVLKSSQARSMIPAILQQQRHLHHIATHLPQRLPTTAPAPLEGPVLGIVRLAVWYMWYCDPASHVFIGCAS